MERKIYNSGDIRQDRLDVLQDTIDYYWDNKSRICMLDGKCVYKATETSEGCAIGRLVPKDIQDKFGEGSGIMFGHNYDLLPDWLVKLDKYFLQELQYLHDSNKLNHQFISEIKEKFEHYLDVSKLTFPNE